MLWKPKQYMNSKVFHCENQGIYVVEKGCCESYDETSKYCQTWCVQVLTEMTSNYIDISTNIELS